MTAVAAVETEALTGAVHPDHILQIGMGPTSAAIAHKE